MAIELKSSIYRGHEIVVGPTGKCIVHQGDRSGPIVAQTDSESAAMDAVDRLRRQATGARA